MLFRDLQLFVIRIEKTLVIRGGSRTAATSKMERFVIIVNGLQSLTIITKRSILCVAAVLNLPLGDVTEELLFYFEDTYIGRFYVDAPKGNPMFSIELWKMFHGTDAELSQINNSVEDWHHSIQGHLSSCHPSFSKFLGLLKNE